MNLNSLGYTFFCWGDRVAGRAMFEECLPIVREFDNMDGIAVVWTELGRDALAHDELDRAEMLFEESLAIWRDAHDEGRIVRVNALQAEMARRQGDYEQAIRLLSAVLARRQKLGNRDLIAAVLDGQGRVARSQGDRTSAHSLHMEALALRREAGHPITLAHSFHALALLAAERAGRAERAARLFGAAEPYHAALYAYWADLPIWRAEHERGVAAVRAQLGEALSAKLWAEGQAMTLEQAFAYALES